MTPLQIAASLDEYAEAEELLQGGADPDEGEWPPLCIAILGESLSLTILFLRWGADLDLPARGIPPLHIAVYNGDLDIVRFLMAHRVRTFGTEMSIAAEHEHLHVLDFFLRQNFSAEQALVVASNGHPKVVKFLLERRVPVSPLCLLSAARGGCKKSCRYLLRHAPFQERALDLARDPETIRYLRRKSRRCAWCTSMGKLKKCICGTYYCSKECQRQHWPVHRYMRAHLLRK